jgi:LAO/AO transport system kinase
MATPNSPANDLIRLAKSGDVGAFARLLSWIDQSGPKSLSDCSQLLELNHVAPRLGITGPPGAGKSTLIDKLIGQLISKNLKIGVLAVDPSSPFSNGAVLGDRIRYSEHTLNKNVFVRSIGTRGSLGGLSASAHLLLRAFDVCLFDVVIIETVGVGQVEVEIMNVADHTAVVLVPESGDSIQAMKSGILEIADTVIVNKSDRPGADQMVREIEASMEIAKTTGTGKSTNKVLKCSAINGDGVSEVAKHLWSQLENQITAKDRQSVSRLKAEAKSVVRMILESKINGQIQNIKSQDDLIALYKNLRG